MKLTHDPKANIAYIAFKAKRGKVRTVVVSDELNVDVVPEGSIYGVELLSANAQLAARKALAVRAENKASGESQEIELAV